MNNFLAIFRDDRSSLFIEQSPNLCTRAFSLLSNSSDFFHRFPRSIDHSFSLSDCRKLIVNTVHVSDTKTKLIDVTPGHAPTWLLLRQRGACPSSWSPAPLSRGWLQKRCLLPQGSTRSAESLHHPCTRNQTEVEVQLYLFSTVLDVVNRVLGIRRTSCTRVDSESVSDCVVPSRRKFTKAMKNDTRKIIKKN